MVHADRNNLRFLVLCLFGDEVLCCYLCTSYVELYTDDPLFLHLFLQVSLGFLVLFLTLIIRVHLG